MPLMLVKKACIYNLLRVPAPPYAAILLCDRIILNRHAILHCTIPKPYIHWKAMLLSTNTAYSFIHPSPMPCQDHKLSVCIWFWYATTKNTWSFQTILTRSQNCLLGGMLVALRRQDTVCKYS